MISAEKIILWAGEHIFVHAEPWVRDDMVRGVHDSVRRTMWG